MSEMKDGGPAFPESCNGQIVSGMTLRDWFAGQALAGMCASIKYFPTSQPQEIVISAWDLADQMLIKRKEKL